MIYTIEPSLGVGPATLKIKPVEVNNTDKEIKKTYTVYSNGVPKKVINLIQKAKEVAPPKDNWAISITVGAPYNTSPIPSEGGEITLYIQLTKNNSGVYTDDLVKYLSISHSGNIGLTLDFIYKDVSNPTYVCKAQVKPNTTENNLQSTITATFNDGTVNVTSQVRTLTQKGIDHQGPEEIIGIRATVEPEIGDRIPCEGGNLLFTFWELSNWGVEHPIYYNQPSDPAKQGDTIDIYEDVRYPGDKSNYPDDLDLTGENKVIPGEGYDNERVRMVVPVGANPYTKDLINDGIGEVVFGFSFQSVDLLEDYRYPSEGNIQVTQQKRWSDEYNEDYSECKGLNLFMSVDDGISNNQNKVLSISEMGFEQWNKVHKVKLTFWGNEDGKPDPSGLTVFDDPKCPHPYEVKITHSFSGGDAIGTPENTIVSYPKVESSIVDGKRYIEYEISGYHRTDSPNTITHTTFQLISKRDPSFKTKAVSITFKQ